MANRKRRRDNWAKQVPREHATGLPYEDFGWEPHQSGLPEFRDPEEAFMPRERGRVERWRPLERTPTGDYRTRRANEERLGPYSGMGPRGYRRPDERIYEEICDRMSQHGLLDASDIEVHVQNGEVILKGTVNGRRMKRLAEDIAESVTGVHDVYNQLRAAQTRRRGAGQLEDVRGSGVYPASGPLPEGNAEVRGMMEWGRGERGAQGYFDHGESELRIGKNKEQREES